MAWTAHLDMRTQRLPITCGGLRRMPERGTGVISGTTKINNVTAACRVALYYAEGTLAGFRRTESNGSYSFIGLPLDEYMLVITDDRQTAKRGKIEHVVIS